MNSRLPDLSSDPPPRPAYGAAFRCIGPECEDTCCDGWDIPVDRSTYKRYLEFPPGRLGELVSNFVQITAPPGPDALYATIQRLPSGQCAFFGSDRLCRIQKDYGPELLSASCSIYPRNLNQVSAILETTLSLSCPEAARNVLLNPDIFEQVADPYSGGFRTDNRFHLRGGDAQTEQLLEIRKLVLGIIRERSEPLERRLIRIGCACRFLEETGRVPTPAEVSASLHDLRPEADPAARLRLILRLSADRVHDRSCGSRFSELYWNLVETIASAGSAAPETDVQRFLAAEQTCFAPYTHEHPFVLENFLINYILQHLFPFGRTGGTFFVARSPQSEFYSLAAQFLWLKGLMVGIAGTYKSALHATHIVFAVQSFTRATENYPGVIAAMMRELQERHLDSLESMACLLTPAK